MLAVQQLLLVALQLVVHFNQQLFVAHEVLQKLHIACVCEARSFACALSYYRLIAVLVQGRDRGCWLTQQTCRTLPL